MRVTSSLEKNHLQEPCRKDRRHEYLLLQRHVQSPDAGHRKYQDCKVRNDVEDSRGLKEGIKAKAMARCHQRVPKFLPGSTYSDFEHGPNEMKDQVAPDTEMNPEIDEHVAFSGGCENAKVLKPDGESDEEDHKAVDNSGDVDPLNLPSVQLCRPSLLLDESHVKHLGEGVQLDVPHMSSSAEPSGDPRRDGLTNLEQLPGLVGGWVTSVRPFTHASTMTSERRQ